MIHKITIENFFSIADRQELVLDILDNAPALPCFHSSAALPATRLPVSLGFFGPNASGKTTVLKAVIAAADFARDSFLALSEEDLPALWFQPYMQKEWWGRPSIIMIELDAQLSPDHPAELFRYELHITHSSAVKKTVAYEALSHAPKNRFRKLFERKEQIFKFSEEFNIDANDPRTQSIRPDASIISTLAQFNHPILTHLRNLLAGLQTNLIFGKKTRNSWDALLKFYDKNPALLENLNRELKRFDFGLEEMIVKQTNSGLFAEFKHIGLDAPIIMLDESAGTQSFIEIFPRLHFALEYGAVAILDELDTDIHPLLLPEILHWFTNQKRNKHGAQLFFTAHNPALLNELEKEQIFFTEKPSGKSTQVYSACDIKGLRREPSLMKKYLSGELGAVPNIG